MKAALSAQINKSDRNDARGIAQMMRVGLYRPVHVKTLASQKRRMLLTSLQLLQAKALDIENDLRGTLRNFGLKVGMVGTVEFEARIRELVADHPDLAAIVERSMALRAMAPSQEPARGAQADCRPRGRKSAQSSASWPLQSSFRSRCVVDRARGY